MRTARWCLILFQVVWLNAVLPGHTRGIVTVAGSSAASARDHACCASEGSSSTRDDNQDPSPERRSRCAVCFFAATMAAATPLVSPLTPLCLAEILPAPAPAVAPSLDRPLAYLGRGPPVHC